MCILVCVFIIVCVCCMHVWSVRGCLNVTMCDSICVLC